MRYTRAYVQRADDSADGPITFVASTGDVARDGFVIDPKGWKLDNFKANPVVQWAHSYSMPPIGRGLNPRIDGSELLIDVEFDRDDPFAAEIERKVRTGYLQAVSVGWDGRYEDANPDDNWPGGFREADLLEVSVVPVPADPNALKASAQLATRTVAAELVDMLTELEPGTQTDTRAGAVLSKRNLELVTNARDALNALIEAATKKDDESDSTDEQAAFDEAFARFVESIPSIKEKAE